MCVPCGLEESKQVSEELEEDPCLLWLALLPLLSFCLPLSGHTLVVVVVVVVVACR